MPRYRLIRPIAPIAKKGGGLKRAVADGGNDVEDKDDRPSSALELFFDLVFAVAVAELAKTLTRDPSLLGFVHYAALFIPVWWAWVGYCFYADRFECADIVHRLMMLAAMLAIAALAVSLPGAFAGSAGADRFVVSYVAVRIMLIAFYLRTHGHEPRVRPLTTRYLLGFGAGAAVWLASVTTTSPWRYGLWTIGMLIELATPLLSASAITEVQYHVSHIRERLGLFTIIVLGETVVLSANGLAHDRLGVAPSLGAALGFLVAAASWWIYFDFVDEAPLRRWLGAGQTYLYGHLLVFAGIAATGVGVLLASRATECPPFPEGGRWALCGGCAAFLFALGLIQLANVRRWRDAVAWARISAALFASALAVVDLRLPPLALEALLLTGMAVQIVVERRITTRTGETP